MNLAICGIEADFGPEHADTFRRDLRADYVLANPPFNDSDWFRKDDDVRWQFGIPPKTKLFTIWDDERWKIGAQEIECLIHKLP